MGLGWIPAIGSKVTDGSDRISRGTAVWVGGEAWGERTRGNPKAGLRSRLLAVEVRDGPARRRTTVAVNMASPPGVVGAFVCRGGELPGSGRDRSAVRAGLGDGAGRLEETRNRGRATPKRRRRDDTVVSDGRFWCIQDVHQIARQGGGGNV